jgi:Icc protein
LTAEQRLLSGVNSDQAMNLVHLYEEQVVHSVVPLGDRTEITGFSTKYISTIENMTPDQRLEMFSNKKSPFNLGEQPI